MEYVCQRFCPHRGRDLEYAVIERGRAHLHRPRLAVRSPKRGTLPLGRRHAASGERDSPAQPIARGPRRLQSSWSTAARGGTFAPSETRALRDPRRSKIPVTSTRPSRLKAAAEGDPPAPVVEERAGRGAGAPGAARPVVDPGRPRGAGGAGAQPVRLGRLRLQRPHGCGGRPRPSDQEPAAICFGRAADRLWSAAHPGAPGRQRGHLARTRCRGPSSRCWCSTSSSRSPTRSI